mmetsp:Transcript_5233/g.18654  ORF Transcript_5233/g.18654 Transcript_5233/m.18654 type:complete len:94 (-) Transcript_5233:106-387(-)
MFYAAMYALKGRDERRNAAALSQLSDFDLGGRSSGHPMHAHTQVLTNRHANSLLSKVPAISDCGLFGTDCDGNTYLQSALPTHATPTQYHLSP